MLDILFLSPKIPYPLNEGGKIVIFNTIKALSLKGHKISLFALTSDGNELYVDEIKKYCTVILASKNTRNSISGALKNLFSSVPYNISKYHSSTVAKKLRGVLSQNKFDLVQIENLHMAYYVNIIRNEFGLPVVLREHNVESTIMERFCRHHANPFVKLYAFMQYKKIYRYESSICAQFDRCVTISETDAVRLNKMNSNLRTVPIPSGVDTTYFSPIENREEPYCLVHVGSMTWRPNVEAIVWFCKEIFPLIKAQCSSVKFYIVGGNPPAKIRNLASDCIIVTGYVKDPREYIARGQVYVVPLLTGGGIRIKILEAFAMKKALVSTSVGAEGIPVEHGRHLSLADTPEPFAKEVIALFRDQNKRRGYAVEGYRLIHENYTWQRIAAAFEDIYRDILSDRRYA